MHLVTQAIAHTHKKNTNAYLYTMGEQNFYFVAFALLYHIEGYMYTQQLDSNLLSWVVILLLAIIYTSLPLLDEEMNKLQNES